MSTENESLLKFPCDVPIKVLGYNEPEFREAVLSIISTHYGAAYKLAEQQSKQGAYLSFTITVRAESRAQIDAVYQELVRSPRVVMAL